MLNRVSELTGLALQILNYGMYDRNGAPTDSISQLIEHHQLSRDSPEDHPKPTGKRSQPSGSRQEQEKRFMEEFGIPDLHTVLDDPAQYAETQMASFLAQLQQRIMQTDMMVRNKRQAKDLIEANSKLYQKEVVVFCAQVRKSCTKAIRVTEEELKRERKNKEKGNRKINGERANELLEEFNMLLQLLKIILDDMPDEWQDLDRILRLLRTSNESLQFIQ
ncbi:AGAP007773-PA-like protein [Anopheles sinensis]|uniref:AGAP007773-PA-like protein n=1 Tax=Anopheles sinensis TaxID=74873 RepID=A0A084W7K3_ANOSI|nr:AGAP007773-PA-like protein [Anopheles sinensis]